MGLRLWCCRGGILPAPSLAKRVPAAGGGCFDNTQVAILYIVYFFFLLVFCAFCVLLSSIKLVSPAGGAYFFLNRQEK